MSTDTRQPPLAIIRAIDNVKPLADLLMVIARDTGANDDEIATVALMALDKLRALEAELNRLIEEARQ